MYLGSTPPPNYTYAQLSKVLEQNRTVAQVKGAEVEAEVERDFSAHLDAAQAQPQDETLKLSLGFVAEA
ncbi:hypothetical protein GV819_17015 [Pseudomonas sp. Fl5BN2]|uniref:hypothetical protein n=1 Tax=Pseudomonas sp. Fl5BN2 TaxID=2697652 RepID=UPI00137764B8|nr:hypothetical protein [Pseudomonas sp. Fl5BN2]NBF03989.1 hypothetical protein [Pseudomonas sp. Fl5BN2]